jgi:hypothetical protein
MNSKALLPYSSHGQIWRKHCSSTASETYAADPTKKKTYAAGVYVQLIRNSNIVPYFKQQDYITTLLMTNEVRTCRKHYRIEFAILARHKIQHNITHT